MKKAFRVLTAALLAVQSMTSLHTVQADTKMESDRITIENGTFMYEGEPFISIGATDYGRLNSSYVHIEQSISDMAAYGLNTLRMCDYLENVYNTENLSDYRDETLWTQIDFMLYQAEKYGLKVILDLSTFRSFFFRHGIDPYAESTYPLWEEAVEFVTNRKNTFTGELYKDAPTIFCYAIMGEPVVYSTEDVFDVENEFASRSPLVVSNAILHVAEQLEIHSPDTLVQSGGLLHFPRSEDLKIDGAYYWDYLLASEYIDFASVHIYPDQGSLFNADGNLIEENTGEWLHLAEYVQSAKAVNKPLLVEEFGYNRNLDNASDDACAAYYRYAFETMTEAGVQNTVFWNWGYSGAFDLSYHQPDTVSVISEYIAKWNVTPTVTGKIWQPPFTADNIAGEVLLQGFESPMTIEATSFVTGGSIQNGNAAEGESCMKLELNCTQDNDTAWLAFDVNSGVSAEDYDYYAMDVYLSEGADGMYIMMGLDCNNWQERYVQTAMDAKTNYVHLGEWTTLYVPLSGGMSNAFETVWQNTDGGVGTGEINRCDITIFGQTARGKCDLLIDNIRLIAVDALNGDVNADGQFTVADVLLLQKWLLAVPDANLANWKAGDLCRDDRLDAFDLCLMKKILVSYQTKSIS